MYRRILIPIDNSQYSNNCIDIGISIAKRMGSQLVGSHVYSGALHDRRFKDMQIGLPQHYQQEERLKKSREIHNSLIDHGLRLISDAYLDVFEKKCIDAQIPFDRKIMEGKNWFELVNDVKENSYDLVIMGILGLGCINGNLIGSVCERVVRRISTDVIIIKNNSSFDGKIVVAIDGSTHSFAALKKAISLGKLFDLPIEAISVFDPHFHHTAFKGLVGVLSDEAGKMFRFKEQELLHDEIINKGLRKIYQGYLDEAKEIGIKEGVDIMATLLEGKAYHEINKYLTEKRSSILVISRFGAHQTEGLDIGSTAENLLRVAPCNVLITSN